MSGSRHRLSAAAWWSDASGATAAEFALIIPGFVALTVGVFYLCVMMFTASALHFAVEDAARCASVKTTVCSTVALTKTYAAGRYKGAGPATFTPSTPACGNQVVGTVTYVLNTGLARISTPISATACYPLP